MDEAVIEFVHYLMVQNRELREGKTAWDGEEPYEVVLTDARGTSIAVGRDYGISMAYKSGNPVIMPLAPTLRTAIKKLLLEYGGTVTQ